MGKQVRTYLVRHDGMKVGDEVRNFGDFMPEATEFQNLRTYLGAGYLEEVFVDQEEIDEWRKNYKERLAAEEEELEIDDADEDVDEETVSSISESDIDGESGTVKTAPKKKVARKTTKKSVVKTTKKKGK